MKSQQWWRPQSRLAWKLAESENQAEILYFANIIQLTQFSVSTIHIPSSLRKGIKLGIHVVPACTVYQKYLDASSKSRQLNSQFPIIFQSHGPSVRTNEIGC